MNEWLLDGLKLIAALLLVLLNSFFVAAEFALVKVRGSQLDELVREGRPFAKTAQWLSQRLDAALGACQLGITIASLGLGWIGEPAFAALMHPLFGAIGVTSETAVHTISFIVAFSVITALHLVIGELAPKTLAIYRPVRLALWCALPLKWFYMLFYPLLILFNICTGVVLKLFGIEGVIGHESPHSEDEIRALVAQAHVHGELTGNEHRLIQSVFEFDDLTCRRVMVPRNDVVYLDANQPVSECIELARRTMHTRYPLCDGSLDHVLGVVHIKDLVGLDLNSVDLRSIARPPKKVPETAPISKVLRHFQVTHQLLALVVDEFGTLVGIVTLENVLEEIIGPVEDEFDIEPPEIVPAGPGEFMVQGRADVDDVNRALNLSLASTDVDTFSGLLMERMGRILEAGDEVELEGATAEVLEVRGARATRVRVKLSEAPADST